MKLNLNTIVRVKLTPFGKEVLQKKFDNLASQFPSAHLDLSLPKEDSDGYSKWELWYLMKTLGTYLKFDRQKELPFEIEIEFGENT